MTSKSGVSSQIISLPTGGGALKGIGEKFQPDLHTGTGNLSIPIALPNGRNGFQPQLSLSYSTGSGNGPFGLGWVIGMPNISRKTSKGIPVYRDKFDHGEPVWTKEEDTFILSGAEDLVHVGNGFYRPRTEGLFAKIQKIKAPDGQICWKVTTKDGISSIYGKNADSRIFIFENDTTKIFQWLLDETEDTFGNKILYKYKRDTGDELQSNPGNFPEERNHSYNQLYLQSIEYVDYEEPGVVDEKFLFKIELDYGEYDDNGDQPVNRWNTRPDAFSSYNAGFEVRTARRCNRILIKRRTEGSIDKYELFKSYGLQYNQDGFTDISLLKSIKLNGHKDGKTESYPPVVFDYTKFEPRKRKYETFSAQEEYLPEKSLADPNYEIIDLFGNGLPCIVNSSHTGWRYWRNLGNMRFAFPKSIKHSPFGIVLEDDGVQFADMNGDGSVDLLVTSGSMRGYYSKESLNGEWSEFHHYHQAPSFNLKDPNVKLVDLDGNGVSDVLATLDHHFLFIRNINNTSGLDFDQPVAIERKHDLDLWPDLFFGSSDQRSRLADMSGDGLQDIVLVHSGRIDYWPNMGYGKFGKRISMNSSPRFSYNFDPKRMFLTDINGDGLADMVYVDFEKVHLWINCSGNSWSEEIIIHGTPIVTNSDSVKIADMKGTGTAGVLWSYDYSLQNRRNYKYLDFTGGEKPLLLNYISNNTGAETRIEYRPSTYYDINDAKDSPWKTTIPFAVHVVSRIDVYDYFSKDRFTTEYRYHHGYWDGIDREFRGFGRVDHLDSEVFEDYNSGGLHQDKPFNMIPKKYFSPPTETRTWFHQGPVSKGNNSFEEIDLSEEFWSEDQQVLARPPTMVYFLESLSSIVRRNAIRTLSGRILRTELYSQDGTENQDRPFSVTESLHGIMALPIGHLWGSSIDEWRQAVFFPCELGQRTTQWERGYEPMTHFNFITDYDDYGQALKLMTIAIPRGRDFLNASSSIDPYLVTYRIIEYAQRDDNLRYIVNRIANITDYEIINDGKVSIFTMKELIEHESMTADHKRVINQVLNFYDGAPYQGLPYGKIGDYGALVRTESLVITKDVLSKIYDPKAVPLSIPPYLTPGSPDWTLDYPTEFKNLLPIRDPPTDHTRPNLEITQIGYGYSTGSGEYEEGYFAVTGRKAYDFHENPSKGRGIIKVEKDALGHNTVIDYDIYDLLPIQVFDAANLRAVATYDYRFLQPNSITDANGNITRYIFSPLGLLESIFRSGKPDAYEGDRKRASKQMTYNLTAFIDSKGLEPIHFTTFEYVYHDTEMGLSATELEERIESVKFFDGFGRIVQIRTLAEDIAFGDKDFGNIELPIDPRDPVGSISGRYKEDGHFPVVVSGWQIYDNKGRVVEKYEPFFSIDLEYDPKERFGIKATMYYDALGRVIDITNPDASKNVVLYGIPLDSKHPEQYRPSPWEIYNYDSNDNSGRTHRTSSSSYDNHWDTPNNIVLDAFGRTVETIERNGPNPMTDTYRTQNTYDIKGNLLTTIDALGRIISQYIYDLTNRAIYIRKLDAGYTSIIVDASGNAIEERDTKGALNLHSYDILNRSIRLWARDTREESITLREYLIYGDDEEGTGMTRDRAASLNLLANLYKQYDEAGLVAFTPDNKVNSKSYDFKGNILEKARQVIKDDAILSVFERHTSDWNVQPFRIDWQPSIGVKLEDHITRLLDPFEYRRSFVYNALNKAKRIYYPKDVSDSKRKELNLQYNRAGVLERVDIDNIPYIEYIGYNAKGQQTLVVYGNKVMTRCSYDENTFRIVRMRTENYTKYDALTYVPFGKVFQDFIYEFDLIGNILKIHDYTPKSGVTGSHLGMDSLDRNFVYDPLYRLHSTTGREHSYNFLMMQQPWSDELRATDLTITRSYLQQFEYDSVGNIKMLQHQADGSGYNRAFTLVPNSNRLDSLSVGRISYRYIYDANGNLVQETSSRHFEWDHRNLMRAFYVKTERSEPSIYAHYLYDSSGERVKKVVRKQGGKHTDITVNIDGVFEFQRKTVGSVVSENNSVHVMENRKRIAIIRVGIPFSDDASPAIKYQLGDHLNSCNVIIDDVGVLVNREEYTPFGDTSFGSFGKKRYRFTGKEKDEENGLYRHGVRYYAPWLTRWISFDPLEFAKPGGSGETTGYTYAHNNPVILVDPSGLISWGSIAIIAAAVIVGTVIGVATAGFAAPILGSAGSVILSGAVGGAAGGGVGEFLRQAFSPEKFDGGKIAYNAAIGEAIGVATSIATLAAEAGLAGTFIARGLSAIASKVATLPGAKQVGSGLRSIYDASERVGFSVGADAQFHASARAASQSIEKSLATGPGSTSKDGAVAAGLTEESGVVKETFRARSGGAKTPGHSPVRDENPEFWAHKTDQDAANLRLRDAEKKLAEEAFTKLPTDPQRRAATTVHIGPNKPECASCVNTMHQLAGTGVKVVVHGAGVEGVPPYIPNLIPPVAGSTAGGASANILDSNF